MTDKRRFRNACFTINNYDDEDVQNLKSWDKISYLKFAHEIAPSTGTPHLQGYVEFKGQVSGTQMKKRFPKIHYEYRYANSTAQQAAKYCNKGEVVEIGEISAQGKRTDLDALIEYMDTNTNLNDIKKNFPKQSLLYGKKIRDFIILGYEHRTEKPHVVWLWGAAGTGKTREATDCDDYFIVTNSKFWDGYTQQKRVIFDDFSGCEYESQYRFLLRILDRYKISVEIKGGSIPLNSPEIYITCEFPPSHYWNGNQLAQIERRCAEIRQITQT